MPFGKSFHTRREAIAELKRIKKKKGFLSDSFKVRKMSKITFPLRKKLFHVGSYIEFLNFE